MAVQRARVQGWRAGLLVFLAFAIAAPLAFLAFGQGDGRSPYLVYGFVVAGLLAAWGVYALVRGRVRGREA